VLPANVLFRVGRGFNIETVYNIRKPWWKRRILKVVRINLPRDLPDGATGKDRYRKMRNREMESQKKAESEKVKLGPRSD